jgi:tetratricopeptide (TPR) repeat protein
LGNKLIVPHEQWSLLERFLISSRVLWFYAVKLVWPQPLIFIYPKWHIDASVWWQYAFGVSFVVTVVGLWFARKRISRGPLVAVLYFAGTLFPALGFIDVYPMRFSFVADHFAYLASIGLISLIAAAAATVASRLRLPKRWMLLGVTVVLLSYGRVSFVRCLDYKDAETLWVATLVENPNCWMANHHLAMIRFRQHRFGQASALFRRAQRRQANDEPSHKEQANLHYYLGATLLALGKSDEGTAQLHQAAKYYLRLAASESPPNAQTHNNLGILYGQLQQYQQSIRHFQRSLEIDPTQPETHLNLGELYYQLKRVEESVACFGQALKIDPQSVRAHYYLGTFALAAGKRQQAMEHMQEALRIKPDFEAAQIVLQQILTQ